MSVWDEFVSQLKALAQQILDDIVEDKFGIEAIATQNELNRYIADVDDFAAGAYGAAETIIESLEKFKVGQCDKETLIREAEECYGMLDDFEVVRWSNKEAKQRYVNFRGAVGDLPDLLKHGAPRRRNYYVYVHKAEDGKVFYVGKGTGKRAWSEDRDTVWHRYVKEELGGRYNVEIVKNELDEDEALQMENEVMLMHGDRLLNFAKAIGGVRFEVTINQEKPQVDSVWLSNDDDIDLEESTRYWKLRESNRTFVKETKPFELANMEMAVTRYREALSKMREYEEIGRRLSRSRGLRGEYEDDVQQATGDVAILDRLTMCLTKLNRSAEAVTEAEHHFTDFPGDRETSIGQTIVKRIERIKSNARKNK
jgi:hypothetical protein